MYAHKLSRRLATVRKNGALDFLRPDGKTQVTVEYENGSPKRVDAVVVSAQHKPDVTYEDLREAIIEEVIKKVIPAKMTDGDTKYFINPTGRFAISPRTSSPQGLPRNARSRSPTPSGSPSRFRSWWT
jgi:S-adenosylmethionine synthetase